MKATEQYFAVVQFITLYKVVLTFESVNEIIKGHHSNESYWGVLCCGTVYCTVQCGSNFESVNKIIKVSPFKWNLLSSTFLWYFITFESVDEILKCYHSNENYWVAFPCGTVHHAVFDDFKFQVPGCNSHYGHSNKSYWAELLSKFILWS